MKSQYPVLDADSVFFILALFESKGIITEVQVGKIMSRLKRRDNPSNILIDIGWNIRSDEKRDIMIKDLINKIEEGIVDWRKIAESGIAPKLLGETFQSGWRVGINGVCNTIERIISEV